MSPGEVVRRLAAARPVLPDAQAQLLETVSVAELADAAQHFRCEPYSATIRASACLERQRTIGTLAEGEVWFDHHGKERRRGRQQFQTSVRAAIGQHRAVRCADCELGRAVAQRLGDPARPADPLPDAEPPTLPSARLDGADVEAAAADTLPAPA